MAIDDAHDLMPHELVKDIPPLYATQDQADPIARIKLFTADSSWTWFVIEYDAPQRLAFGFVIGHEQEFGYFDLAEIETVRGPLGLKVERDLYFEPKQISELRK